MIYFDNNATTQVDPDVLQLMLPYLQNQYGNPSSAYSFGKYAAKAVETARNRSPRCYDANLPKSSSPAAVRSLITARFSPPCSSIPTANIW